VNDVTEGRGWLARMRGGLARSAERLTGGIAGLFGGTLDEDALDRLEEALIAADLGPAVAARIVSAVGDAKPSTEAAARRLIADEIEAVLRPVAKPLAVTAFPRPHTILVVGVNGSGKTTTIAKLGHLFQEQDYAVMMAAGDTFRAAAVEQLRVWGDRLGVPVVSAAVGADAAGLAFTAMEQGRASGRDVLLVDTAGRLQNRGELMAELAKVKRVLAKQMPAAPHDVVLVLDATTGQNALDQVRVFQEISGVTGLVMTKLDGTARGGVLVAAAQRFGLPIHAIGVGERLGDLRPFDPRAFAESLAGVV
jgi:fused signal recognition particle receptor